MTQKIVLASSNPGKLKEFQQLLGRQQFEILPQGHFDIADAIEDGLSFVENAIIKARNAAKHSGLAAIADDSGLEVDALNGAPGIYSARFAGPAASDQDNNDQLLEKLKDVPVGQRSARFHCLLVYMRHATDPTPLICHGSWEGEILLVPQGDNGFGYDPLFYIPELDCSSAQLAAADKNRLSHRGQAMAKLLSLLAG